MASNNRKPQPRWSYKDANDGDRFPSLAQRAQQRTGGAFQTKRGVDVRKVEETLDDMFLNVFDAEIIRSVAQACDWKLNNAVEKLLTLSVGSEPQGAKAKSPNPRSNVLRPIPITKNKANKTAGPSKQKPSKDNSAIPSGSPSATNMWSHRSYATPTRNKSVLMNAGHGTIKVTYKGQADVDTSDDDDADVVIEEEKEFEVQGHDVPLGVPTSQTMCQFLTPLADQHASNDSVLPSGLASYSKVAAKAKVGPSSNNDPAKTGVKRSKHWPKFEKIKKHINDGVKIMVIMRGCPGSGKTSLARHIIKATYGENHLAYIFSTDQFFSLTGKYMFNPRLLPEAHEWNRQRVIYEARIGTTPIIIDNTNIEAWEMKPYAQIAVEYGYLLELLEPRTTWNRNPAELERKNIHNVTRRKIEDMLQRFDQNVNVNSLLTLFNLNYAPNNKPPQYTKQIQNPQSQLNTAKKKTKKKTDVSKVKKNTTKDNAQQKKPEHTQDFVNVSKIQNPENEEVKDILSILKMLPLTNVEQTLGEASTYHSSDVSSSVTTEAIGKENEKQQGQILEPVDVISDGSESSEDEADAVGSAMVWDGESLDDDYDDDLNFYGFEESDSGNEVIALKCGNDSERAYPCMEYVLVLSDGTRVSQYNHTEEPCDEDRLPPLKHQNRSWEYVLNEEELEQLLEKRSRDIESLAASIENERKAGTNAAAELYEFMRASESAGVSHEGFEDEVQTRTDMQSSAPEGFYQKESSILEDSSVPLITFDSDSDEEKSMPSILDGHETKRCPEVDESNFEKNNKGLEETMEILQDTKLNSDFGKALDVLSTEDEFESVISSGISDDEERAKHNIENIIDDNAVSGNKAFDYETSITPVTVQYVVESIGHKEVFSKLGAGDLEELEKSSNLESDEVARGAADKSEMEQVKNVESLNNSGIGEIPDKQEKHSDEVGKGNGVISKLENITGNNNLETVNELENVSKLDKKLLFDKWVEGILSDEKDEEKIPDMENYTDASNASEVQRHTEEGPCDSLVMGDVRQGDEEEKEEIPASAENKVLEIEGVIGDANDTEKLEKADENKEEIVESEVNNQVPESLVGLTKSGEDLLEKWEKGCCWDEKDEEKDPKIEGDSCDSTPKPARPNRRQVVGKPREEACISLIKADAIAGEAMEDEFWSVVAEPVESWEQRIISSDTERREEDADAPQPQRPIFASSDETETKPREEDVAGISPRGTEGLEGTDSACIGAGDVSISVGNTCQAEGIVHEKTSEEQISSPVKRKGTETIEVPEEACRESTINSMETNTHHSDFILLSNINIGSEVDVPGVKIIHAFGRDIADPAASSVDTHEPRRSGVHTLDKSSMTLDSSSVAAESGNIKEHIEELHRMFPRCPVDILKELFDKCNKDVNWTVDVLLETANQGIELTSVSGVSDFNESLAQDTVQNDSEENTEISVELNSRSQPSAELVVPETHAKHISPKRNGKKDRNAPMSEMAILLKKRLEENIVINDEHYSEHVSRIRKIRHGELPDTSETMQGGSFTEMDPEDASMWQIPLENAASNGALRPEAPEWEMRDSVPEEVSFDEEEEENVQFKLDSTFADQLHKLFGTASLPFKNDAVHTLNLPISLARQLHCYLMEAEQNTYDLMMQEDEELARQLQQQENEVDPAVETRPADLREIMEMEMALAMYKADQKQFHDESKDDMATRLKKNLLCEWFPTLPRDVLVNVFDAHDHSFDQTIEVLVASTDEDHSVRTVMTPEARAAYEKALLERARQESEKTKESSQSDQADGQGDVTQERAFQDADHYRTEASRYCGLRNECQRKAQRAYKRGHPSVAAYYAQMAALHKQKIEENNAKAASSLLLAHSLGNLTTTLDLHFLYVVEALQVLDMFLDHHVRKLIGSGQRSKQVFVITGRGARSSGGRSRIKPAVVQRLEQRGLRHSEVNPGLLGVIVTRNSVLSTSVDK